MVKLSSGREIELKPLKFFQRAEIKDLALKNYRENIPVSLVTCGKCVIYATGITEDELNKWGDAEIYEAGAEVFKTLFISEEDKKK
ncbi:hypothetical protein AMJ80_03505 [bacterium SM23_31]|nr:MAG: hypothetical protein AMJ80_03505 [bacterium SM23_31]